MFKRAILRLLLFGVPFTFGYLATRPVQPPARVSPAFVICAYPDGEMRVTPTAAACAAGTSVLVPATNPSDSSSPALEIGTDRSINLPF
jgi:hypothetical protein